MRDDPSVIMLVERARDGDQRAWDQIVERYAPLVWSICARYQLNRADIDDVGQTVWLLLVEQLGNLRVSAALPGWLATTTQRECLRVLRAARRYDLTSSPGEGQMSPDQAPAMVEDEIERRVARGIRRPSAAVPAAAVHAAQRTAAVLCQD